MPTRRAAALRPYRYLLGDARRESARLRAQARLWDPTALALFDRLGIRRGWRVLEVGPGQGSLHIELRRRVRGPVDAVEPSPVFRSRLRQLSARDGFGRGQVWEATLAESALPRRTYDLIFARWVFLFLPNPEQHVRQLVAALKPGGLLAIEDYRRETLSMIPCPPEFAAFLGADTAFFATQGGDASIAGRLPAIFERAGLEVIDITPTIKTGHPGSAVWNWLSTYFLGVMDQLGRLPPFTPAQAASLRRQWIANARKPTSLLIGPTLIDVVGRRRRRKRRATEGTD
ncbi:MAG TPA: class I SAM-dependent methyltransferase [Vicinamibacterales bacterium]|nr:class I SAM-dependent methyltransferase [Vicinamibacterales bacterium]